MPIPNRQNDDYDPDADDESGVGLPPEDDAADTDELDSPNGPVPRSIEGVRFQPMRDDLKKAASSLTVAEVRFCVDAYYTWQGSRIAAGNQAAALKRTDEPHLALDFVQKAFKGFEDDMKAMLETYTLVEPTGMGLWARSILGVGPVLTAGLLAHLDIEKAPTVGHFWRFGGLDPTVKWLGTKGAATLVDEVLNGSKTITADHLAVLSERTNRRLEVIDRMCRDLKTDKYSVTAAKKSLARRPWNAPLKVLFWKLGESFVKVANHERDYYGKVIAKRKLYEQGKNEAGDYAEQAAAKLANFNIGKDTTAYKWYSLGKLPPGHIHARAKRYGVKLFIAHYWEVSWRKANPGKEPVKPYPIAHLGHAHYTPPPVV